MNELRNPSSRVLDREFGAWVAAQFGSNDPQLRKLAEAVSYANGLKHTCLDLDTCQQLDNDVLQQLLKNIRAENVKALLGPSPGQQAIHPLQCSADGKKIWLQKYYQFEKGVAYNLLQRTRNSRGLDASDEALLDQLFDSHSAEHREAARKALTHDLAIITGGPGTGKTWTVARLLVLLLQQNPACRVRLAAPTGKAGARMLESLHDAFKDSTGVMQPYRHLVEKLPKESLTLDALLKITPHSPKARKNQHDPIDCDVLIVDEASMIALPMMYRLLQALTDNTRLVLLGDKNQLASVEAGAVLGDICASKHPGLQSAIATISKSYRFKQGSEIGELAQSLNRGEVNLPPAGQQVTCHHPVTIDDARTPSWLPAARAHYQQLVAGISAAGDDDKASEILRKLADFQILCALRQGPCGVSAINQMMAVALGNKPDGWYEGRPVMITRNDHSRKLYNGDVGMILDRRAIGSDEPVLKACFLSGNTIKEVSQGQMPPHETCYAMTVHKSQGSEYRHVVIVLPVTAEKLGPVLTRELVYTAVTRARDKVDIWCGSGVLQEAATRTIERMSGLREWIDSLQ